MGWWWSSSPSTDTPSAQQPSSIPSPREPLASIQPATASPSAAPTRALTRDEQADREFEALVASFESPSSYSRPQAQNHDRQQHTFPTPNPILTPPLSDTTASEAPVPESELDISPDALTPRTMSCRQAFDQAFYCQSLGGKFNDIYRYGHLRSCSEHWSAFWFCMRVRTYSDKEKEPLIAEWYRDRDERRRKEVGSKLSEDVWEVRTKPVKGAFMRDPDELPAVIEKDGTVIREGRGGEGEKV